MFAMMRWNTTQDAEEEEYGWQIEAEHDVEADRII
jgi:hypothetical protein